MLRLLPKILVPLALFYALSACTEQPGVILPNDGLFSLPPDPSEAQKQACIGRCEAKGYSLDFIGGSTGNCYCKARVCP